MPENGLNKNETYRSKVIVLLLWFFLGQLGVHNFYLGRTGIGITQLILGIVGYATSWILIGFLPLIVLWIWLLVDLIMVLVAPESDNLGWSM